MEAGIPPSRSSIGVGQGVLASLLARGAEIRRSHVVEAWIHGEGDATRSREERLQPLEGLDRAAAPWADAAAPAEEPPGWQGDRIVSSEGRQTAGGWRVQWVRVSGRSAATGPPRARCPGTPVVLRSDPRAQRRSLLVCLNGRGGRSRRGVRLRGCLRVRMDGDTTHGERLAFGRPARSSITTTAAARWTACRN